MKKEDLEKKINIKIPNINLVSNSKLISYINPLTIKKEKTSLVNLFKFDHFPLQELGDYITNDFEYYSLPLFKERKILPFAEDGGGYFFCLNYHVSNNEPSIVLWLRDNEEGKDLALIANSFDEFLSMLKSEEEIEALESSTTKD